jgi:hypothetical protein
MALGLSRNLKMAELGRIRLYQQISIHDVPLHCTALHCTAMQCNAMQCNAMQCNQIRLVGSDSRRGGLNFIILIFKNFLWVFR